MQNEKNTTSDPLDQQLQDYMEQPTVPRMLEPEAISHTLQHPSLDAGAQERHRNITTSRKPMLIRITAGLAACVVLTVLITRFYPGKKAILLRPYSDSDSSQSVPDVPGSTVSDQGDLVAAQSYETLYERISEDYMRAMLSSTCITNKADTNEIWTEKGDAETSAPTTGTGDTVSHTDTLYQTEGVAEADFIKTNGKEIYYLSGNTLFACQAENGKFTSKVNHSILTDLNLSSIKIKMDAMFLLDEKLVLLGTSYTDASIRTHILVYDTNKGNPQLCGSYSQSGCYQDARMLGTKLYLISLQNIAFTPSEDGDSHSLDYVPTYSIGEHAVQHMHAQDIYYPKAPSGSYNVATQTHYTIVAGLDILSPEQPIAIKAFKDYAGSLYCAKENLYLTGNASDTISTRVLRLSLQDGNITPAATGMVEGSVLNQFSMDEWKGNFRIATTTSQIRTAMVTDEETNDVLKTEETIALQEDSSNHLFILDAALQPVGSLRNYAPGERIQSVSFSGDEAYVVTFRQTDPLFRFDLQDPTHPTLTDALKITGFSTFLYQWSDTELLGFGFAGTETGITNGLKVTMFQKHADGTQSVLDQFCKTGEVDSYFSGALYDHKALLLDPEYKLIGFPLTTYNQHETQSFCFVTYENGAFRLLGELQSPDDVRPFTRCVRIGDYVYAFTEAYAVAADMTLQQTDTCTF